MSRPTLPLFPTDEGWPYTDLVRGPDLVDDGEIDLDALELRADPHAYDTLSDADKSRVAAAERGGISGQAVTPFVLAYLHEHSGGETRRVNRDLIVANAGLAGAIAAAHATL